LFLGERLNAPAVAGGLVLLSAVLALAIHARRTATEAGPVAPSPG
jgi:hypothetical protein